MVAMEVPTNYSNCYISYDTSPKDTVCTVWGNNSVCTIEPRKAGDCQIIATCKDKGGNIKATARMSVIVEEDVGDVKYLSFEGSTIINLEKGQKTKLSVNLIGNNVKDTTGNGIKWTIKNSNIVNFTTSKNWGTYTDIQAGKPGRTTITISHDETPPLTIYVVVPGEDDAQVLLTPTEKMLYMGGGSESITARVLNDTGEALVWSVIPADQDIIEMKAKLKGCSISPKKVGAVTIVATLPSQPEAPAKCRVEVKETEKLTFFVLDQQGNEAEINNLNVYPSEEMLVYYRTIPAKDTIQSPGTFETNGVFYVTDLGYPDKLGSLSSDKSALAKRVGFTAASCPKDAGAIVVTGGSTVLSRSYSWSTQTAHYADQTLNVMNSYNYYFALEKNAVTESPDDAYGKTFEVTYHVRPATAYVCFDVSKDGAGSDKRYMGKMSRIQFQNSRGTLKTDTNGTVCNQGTNISYYDSGNVTVDQVTKIATGKIRFKVDGECSEDILVTAKNKPLIATSGNVNKTPELVGQQNLNVDVTYGYRNFKVVVSENSSNKTSILLPDGLNYVRPRYDEATGAIFIPMTVKSGDDPLNGSTKAPVTVTLTVNTSVTKHPHIFGADVVDGKISDQMNQVSCSKGRTKNTFTVTIKNDGMSVKNMAPVNSSGLTRVRSHSYVGNLKLTYWLYDAGASDNKGKLKGPEYHEISIPVYAEKLE